ncbi:MAG: hypothetical protein AAF591_21880, partial [Verrucomicrobiota bacterium]
MNSSFPPAPRTIPVLLIALLILGGDLPALVAQQQNEPPRARRFLPFLDDNKQQPTQPTYQNPPTTPSSPVVTPTTPANPPVRRAV